MSADGAVSESTPLLLIGTGGHSRACIDVVERSRSFHVRGLVGGREEDCLDVLGYPVLGTDEELESLLLEVPSLLVAVGQITDPEPRVRLFEMAKQLGAALPTVISQSATVSSHAELGDGTIVMNGAVVGPASRVGDNCIVNSLALIEHDVTVGSHSHISTGARINGAVTIGERVFVGSGAIVHHGIAIGEGSVVAAGAVVRRSLPPSSVFKER